MPRLTHAGVVRYTALISAVAAAALAGPATALAAPGDLDASFANGGKLTFNPAPGQSLYDDVAIQPDGKIVLVGQAVKGDGDLDFAVSRLNANGSLDTGFGTGGTTLIDFATATLSSNDAGSGVALQSDGKVVVVGTAFFSSGAQSPVVARLNGNGTLDTSFDPGGNDGPGKATIPPSNGSGNDVAVDPNGRIVVTGSMAPPAAGASPDFFLTRLNADGSGDPTFGGVHFYNFRDSDGAVRLVLQQDGKIVMAGFAQQGMDSDVAVARATSDGSLDTGFGASGKLTYGYGPGTNGSSTNDFGADLAVEPDGKILVAGSGGTGNDFAVTRLTATGGFDNSLNGGPTVFANFGGNETANALALQTSGKIVVAGSDDHNFAVARFQPGGTPDLTFGPDGKRTVPFTTDSEALGMALQPDGRIVLVGDAGNAAAVVRLQGDPASAGGAPGGGSGGTGGGTGGSANSVPRCGGKRATIVGTTGKDRLKGTRRADVIVGLGGNDKISGLAGNDVLCGGAGNDKISGGSGNDRLSGDAGKDSVSGDKGNDRLAGGSGVDSLNGGPGRDKLNGNAGKDKLNGGSGKDKLNGGSGKDTCAGKDKKKSC